MKPEPVRLRKELGLLEGFTLIMGNVIGSGIFVAPKGVITYVGSVGMSLAVWAVSGLLTMLGGLCFTELGTMIPQTGGMYVYLHEAFGPLPAFLYLWVTVVLRNNATAAVVALTFASYLIQGVTGGCEAVPDAAVRLLAAILICFLSWVNCMNVKWAAKVQNVFTLSKVVALVVVIVTGAVHLGAGHLDNYHGVMAGTNWKAGAIATAFYQSLFSYDGWDKVYYVAEELKNPERDLPIAIFLATTLLTVLYTLTNAAYLAVLTPAEMISSGAVALTFADRTLGVAARLMPIFVMCSTFGTINGYILMQSRLIFAGARKGQLPEVFSLVSTVHMTPVVAIVVHGVLLLLMLVTSDVILLINYSIYAATLTHLGCMGALFWFRYKEPKRPRPFKVFLVLPVIFTVILVFLLVLPATQNPSDVGVGIALISSGLPVYYFTIHRKDIAGKFTRLLGRLTVWCQVLFMGLPEMDRRLASAAAADDDDGVGGNTSRRTSRNDTHCD
ncbi:Y+L amino acid transporter 2-like isoform X2 [Eriocheir sinensis]|uniref:Y+L amino acid transporter 2-like isoform X2 n=1 Tax=Eriocheir sinensis TaxID=95602 RepID=UPI0021C942F4|nr:Y+L amino acid transporter 2-like isoform X2 [Eriocheir sinensis]